MEAVFSQLVFWHWFAFAVILAIFDVMLGANFLFVWCGFVAAIVGVILLLFPPLSWEYQLLVFGLGVMASIVVWRHYIKKRDKFVAPTLNRRGSQYVGRTFFLDEAIENGRGKIRVDDTQWRVEGEDLAKGEKVRVTDVDGIILKVEKAD